MPFSLQVTLELKFQVSNWLPWEPIRAQGEEQRKKSKASKTGSCVPIKGGKKGLNLAENGIFMLINRIVTAQGQEKKKGGKERLDKRDRKELILKDERGRMEWSLSPVRTASVLS